MIRSQSTDTHLACAHSGLSCPFTPCALGAGDDTVTPPTNTGSTPSPWPRRTSSTREDLTGGQVTFPMVTEWVERVLTVREVWWEAWEAWEAWEVW